MGTFGAIVVVLGAAGLIWFNVKMHDPKAAARKRQAQRAAQARIVCKHCHAQGSVTVSAVSRRKGISGGKATGALLTGGMSMLLVGLSRHEPARMLSCASCGMEWDEA